MPCEQFTDHDKELSVLVAAAVCPIRVWSRPTAWLMSSERLVVRALSC
jgi:hypothetical protein